MAVIDINKQNGAVSKPGTDTVTTVLIVGAGSTGLALAQGLKMAGIPYVVYEKRPSLDSGLRDWNMGLHWGAPALMGLLSEESCARIQSVQVDASAPTAENDVVPILNAQSGEQLLAVPVQKFYRLRRSKLRALLAEGVDIRYGKKLQDITYSEDGRTATAYFEDGTSASARLIIGADGARSTLRKLLIGPERGSLSPQMAPAVPGRHQSIGSLWLLWAAGRARPISARDMDVFFYISWPSSLEEQDATAGWTNAQRLKQLKSFAKNFSDPWRSACEWIEDDDYPVWYMGLSDFDPGADGHRWDNHGGRVTLAGDAAHAMTYQRGQGLNHAMVDAANLVDAIKSFAFIPEDSKESQSLQKEAISAYEEETIERSGAEVRLSTTNTQMLHNWEQVLQSPAFTMGIKRTQTEVH
ncbi:FAD binding domain-containing protein [Rasamsonia emersonii CBS 393.64]|uniref:FAD binding domain-containing protein n=1 Tax=Rasamsonia emersonii (strain ATCC 16479 / CBS 393.64 / IMI 116815) TaxID=1408163 RepID=A0A0F4YJQ5_RASE3|nr:FAD binding domain-containing protein [Rasamsonia emersonii CBS 393.64]KKA18111.1 FAD binding domain-containing protein [Rasamsonia emersonii CBS 393.64]